MVETENPELLGTTVSVPFPGTMLNQSSQAQTSTYYMIPLYEMQKHTDLSCDARSQAGGGAGVLGRAWVKSKRDPRRPRGVRVLQGCVRF